jgi:CHAD domain-containing protein
MERMVSFRLSDDSQMAEFETAVAGQLVTSTDVPVFESWRIYDAFDWRLFAQSTMLRRSGNEWLLTSFTDGRTLRCDAGDQCPMFVWDLPDGALRQTLKPILKARALFELATVDVEETTYRILNNDQKTVARIDYVRIRATLDAAGSTAATYVRLRPVRGYEGHARRLSEALAVGARLDSMEKTIAIDALAAVGRSPGDYSAKLDFKLDPAQRSDEAAKVIYRRLLETMRANEAGICEDIDIEFLHDYRVAIRRTRSALSQIRGVFPSATTDHFKQTFRELGTRTNLLRDLDVYLLAEEDYRSMLPENLRADIFPLFDLLRSQRSAALNQVIEGLGTDEYAAALAEWETYLEHPGVDDPTAPNAALPVIKLARKRIYKRYQRVVESGTYILDHTEDELLHALRLECKKLRYLLEFFASLFPKKEITRLIKQLKQLQENLGDFTDLSVQQESLMEMADQLPDEDPRTRRALIATGALVDTLSREQRIVKSNFAATFTHFAAPANQTEFQELFGPKKKAAKKKPGKYKLVKTKKGRAQ